MADHHLDSKLELIQILLKMKDMLEQILLNVISILLKDFPLKELLQQFGHFFTKRKLLHGVQNLTFKVMRNLLFWMLSVLLDWKGRLNASMNLEFHAVDLIFGLLL